MITRELPYGTRMNLLSARTRKFYSTERSGRDPSATTKLTTRHTDSKSLRSCFIHNVPPPVTQEER